MKWREGGRDLEREGGGCREGCELLMICIDCNAGVWTMRNLRQGQLRALRAVDGVLVFSVSSAFRRFQDDPSHSD